MPNPIREALEDAGYTQAMVCDLIGERRQRVNDWWRGRRAWPCRVVLDLVSAMEGCNARDELIERIRQAGDA